MLPENYIEVIKLICEELSKSNINWALTGSTSFIIQGMEFTPNDIDIQTDKKGAYEIENRFKKFVKRKVEFSTAEKIRSHFGELDINGIKVEVMGDIQKYVNDYWEDAVDINKHKKLIKFHGMEVPALSIEYESEAYEKMGRIEKAKLLREWKNNEKAEK